MAEPLLSTNATPPFCEQKKEEEEKEEREREEEKNTGTGEKTKEYKEDNVRMSACAVTFVKNKKNRIAPQ